VTTSRGPATGSRSCSNPNTSFEWITTARISQLQVCVGPWSVSGPSGAATTLASEKPELCTRAARRRREPMAARAEASSSAEI